jgi:predicted PurR-regulated permease PerM
MKKVRKVEIAPKSIIFTVFFLLSLSILWQVRSIIVLLFVSFVLMHAIDPAVVRLQKIKIPRILAILLIYGLVIAFIAFTVSAIIPILAEQTTGLINSFPDMLQNFRVFNENNINLTSQLKIFESIPSNITKIAFSIASNIFSALVVLVVTFYLLLEKKNFPKYGDSLFGDKHKDKFTKIMNNLELSLGNWVNAEILLMVMIGLLSFIGYTVLGLKYALPLAIIAGLLEVVPNIGPIIATVIAGLVGLTVSPTTSLFTVIFCFLVQQLENNFIVPKIMSKSIGLNPIVTIVLIMVGGQLGGIGGALLAIPLFLTIQSIIRGLSKQSE